MLVRTAGAEAERMTDELRLQQQAIIDLIAARADSLALLPPPAQPVFCSLCTAHQVASKQAKQGVLRRSGADLCMNDHQVTAATDVNVVCNCFTIQFNDDHHSIRLANRFHRQVACLAAQFGKASKLPI